MKLTTPVMLCALALFGRAPALFGFDIHAYIAALQADAPVPLAIHVHEEETHYALYVREPDANEHSWVEYVDKSGQRLNHTGGLRPFSGGFDVAAYVGEVSGSYRPNSMTAASVHGTWRWEGGAYSVTFHESSDHGVTPLYAERISYGGELLSSEHFSSPSELSGGNGFWDDTYSEPSTEEWLTDFNGTLAWLEWWGEANWEDEATRQWLAAQGYDAGVLSNGHYDSIGNRWVTSDFTIDLGPFLLVEHDAVDPINWGTGWDPLAVQRILYDGPSLLRAPSGRIMLSSEVRDRLGALVVGAAYIELFVDLLPLPGAPLAAKGIVRIGQRLAGNSATATKITAADLANHAKWWIWSKEKGVAKSIRQMVARGWTPSQVTEAIVYGKKAPAENLVNPLNPAIRHIHPETGQSVVQDTVTKEILHFGGPGFRY